MPDRTIRVLTIPVALVLSLALAGPVLAQSPGSFEIVQVQPKATLVAHNSLVKLDITYRCTFPDGGLTPPNSEAGYSGFGGSVTQSQGNGRIVFGNGGAWAGLLSCDGTPHALTDFSLGTDNGHWVPGPATFTFFAQFTDAVSGEFIRFDADYSITITAGRPGR